jgi:hypothetical protein
MAALVACWICGALAMREGYDEMGFDPVDVHSSVEAINGADARHHAEEAGDRWLALRAASHSREVPIGVAKLVLGAAMVLFVVRSFAGREGARNALVQVVGVHAVVVIVGFVVTAAVLRAEIDFQVQISEGTSIPSGLTPEQVEEGRRMLPAVAHALIPFWAVVRTLLSAGIILALTRPRARAFFTEAPSGPLGEG